MGQSAHLTYGTDVGLRQDAGMGTPRCDFQILSQAMDIVTPDPCSKGLQLQDYPFPAQAAPCQ